MLIKNPEKVSLSYSESSGFVQFIVSKLFFPTIMKFSEVKETVIHSPTSPHISTQMFILSSHKLTLSN